MSTHQGKELEAFINSRRSKGKDGLTVSKVANTLGVSRTAIYKWYREESISLDNLEMLKAIGFSPGLKLTVVKNELKQIAEPGSHVQGHNIIRVPLHAVGGFLAGYKNKVFLDMLERYSMPGFMGEYWDFEVEGMSMYKINDERSAKPGDRLLCKKMEGFSDLRRGKGYVLQTIDGLCYKVFEKIKDERAFFLSINEDDPEKMCVKFSNDSWIKLRIKEIERIESWNMTTGDVWELKELNELLKSKINHK